MSLGTCSGWTAMSIGRESRRFCVMAIGWSYRKNDGGHDAIESWCGGASPLVEPDTGSGSHVRGDTVRRHLGGPGGVAKHHSGFHFPKRIRVGGRHLGPVRTIGLQVEAAHADALRRYKGPQDLRPWDGRL